MILNLFTLFHVVVSLAGIFSGCIVLAGFINDRALGCSNVFFLATTVTTSVTGFLFPVHHFMPSHGVGIVSLVVLSVALAALYRHHLAGAWRKTYVITAVLALYLNVFVLVAQLFQKVPALHVLAPQGSEPPFLMTQLAVLLFFLALGVCAVIRFKGTSGSPAPVLP
jgi:hypothetical protein